MYASSHIDATLIDARIVSMEIVCKHLDEVGDLVWYVQYSACVCLLRRYSRRNIVRSRARAVITVSATHSPRQNY